MSVRRSAIVLIGVATMASFAAGWLAGAMVKPKIEHKPEATLAAATVPPEATQPVVAAAPKDDTYETKILPFIKKYCIDCHNADKAGGGLALDGYKTEQLARRGRKDWMAMQEQIQSSMMPPKKRMVQPTKDEREFVSKWIEESLTKVDCGLSKDPGLVTIRRLNRGEYNNTIRDLCGVDFKPADDFPADDVGYGFDNIGDVLSFQPILLEKYMSAAEKIFDEALKIPVLPKAEPPQKRFPQQISVLPREYKSKDNKIVFTGSGSAFLPERFNFPAEGDYIIRFRGWGTKVGNDFPKVTMRVESRIGDKDVVTELKTVTVDASQNKPGTYEASGRFTAGGKRITFAFTNGSDDKDAEKRTFALLEIQIEGPINPVLPPDPASVKLLLVSKPDASNSASQAAEKVLSNFTRRAYRRPVKPAELDRLMKLYFVAAKEEPFEKAIRLPMKAVLCSPHFLYRIEDDPKNPDDVRTLNDFEFATRLSYFLWSTMPDEELYQHALAGDLRKPAVLEAQVNRMLKDAKVRALSENFAGQWLMLRNIKLLTPDKGYFPKWDDALKAGMIGEAEAFFEYVVQNDRPILDFLDADYSLLNGRMAEHYGIKDVFGNTFKKVKLPDGKRGGVITMASTLTVTSNPTRTSPVKRGKWISENILGIQPPPPAPDVPELPPTGQLKGTLRQQMEQHRENPTCAVCHAKLDPLGFGLENFDGIGGWRTTDNKKDIDSSGVLPGGEKFSGPSELKKVLLGKSDQFRNCFAEKVLTFALGRGLEYYDKCALDEIVKAGKSGGDRFAAYVLAVVKSDPFQKRKGKRTE